MRTEGELAEAFRDGDDRAFALLFERYRRPLYVFSLRMLGDGDAARDLVQETFLKVFERRRQLARPDRFRSWLFTIARNGCLTHLRRQGRLQPLEAAPAAAVTAAAAPDAREQEQELELLRKALTALSPEHREVLVLREYQELSYREIAEITEASEAAVKSRLFKARQALQRTLGPAPARRS